MGGSIPTLSSVTRHRSRIARTSHPTPGPSPKGRGEVRGRLGGQLVLRLRLEIAGVVALVQLARGIAHTRLTIRPRFTAGRAPIASVQRWTFLYSCTWRNSPAP